VSYRKLKLITVLLPTVLIGGFELLRHSVWLHNLSMNTGNYLIIILTLVISYIFATWMFKTIEEKNRHLTKEREMRAVFEERERLAKELHDNIAQTLFLLKVNLKKGKVNEASGLVNSIDANVRQAIYNLRMSPEEMISFSKRVEKWLNDWSTVSGIEPKFAMHLPEGYFSPSEEVQLFGIIQEAFTNIRKHSGASTASLELQANQEGWELAITDDGKGFSGNEINTTHYGLLMLRERAQKIEAVVEISSQNNKGTIISVKGSGKNGIVSSINRR
jgi:signal transduction histidine kinase